MAISLTLFYGSPNAHNGAAASLGMAVRLWPGKSHSTGFLTVLRHAMQLEYWRWLVQSYGREGVRDVLAHVPASEIKPRSLRLASLVFGVERFNYAPRGTH